MKKRMLSGALVAHAFALVALGSLPMVACGIDSDGLFPDEPKRDSGAGGANPFAGSLDASLPVEPDAAPPPVRDATVDGDVPVPDAARDVSVPPTPDAARPDTGPPPGCDVDGDGHLARACGGDDCCDLDPAVYPQTTNTYWSFANRCGGYDYDCDGRVAALYVESACRVQNNVCSGEGFMGMVPCGVQGLWQTCQWGPGGRCNPTAMGGATRLQACR